MVLIKVHKLYRTKKDYPACKASICSNPAESPALCQCQKVGELTICAKRWICPEVDSTKP